MSVVTPARTTVVVGAGSSGAVVASRLSEAASEHVVLIEAGPDYATMEELPDSLSDADNPSLVGHDWEYQCHFVELFKNRAAGKYPRGRVIGGTSAVNAALALRGVPEDYDDWASMGNDEWSWDAVLPYFIKLERDRDFASELNHGTSGPIPIFRDPVDEWPTVLQALGVGFQNRGQPLCEDHNAPGATGFGPTPRNKVGRYRASSSATYLKQARQRTNLEVLSETLVTRVLLKRSRAVGVEIARNGARSVVPADRVVLSGGAINTPQILMLSGIGPKDVLERAGVDVLVHLPGVGRHLQDHPIAPLAYRVKNTSTSKFGFRAHLRYSSGEPGCPLNDMYSTPGYILTSSMNWKTDPDVLAALTVNPVVAKPRGSGWVDVISPDPTVHPEIHLNFLEDEIDFSRLAGALRWFLDVLASDPVRGEIGDPLVAPDQQVQNDDQQLKRWLLEHVTTAFHAAGTCRMGRSGDELAVVDQRLRVRGVEGLFVADASVMPSITTGFTNLPCYMIGERLAEWLQVTN
jgi:choline dehydrogenase